MATATTTEHKTLQQIHDELVERLTDIDHEEEALKTERNQIKDAIRALEGRKKPGRPASH